MALIWNVNTSTYYIWVHHEYHPRNFASDFSCIAHPPNTHPTCPTKQSLVTSTQSGATSRGINSPSQPDSSISEQQAGTISNRFASPGHMQYAPHGSIQSIVGGRTDGSFSIAAEACNGQGQAASRDNDWSVTRTIILLFLLLLSHIGIHVRAHFLHRKP